MENQPTPPALTPYCWDGAPLLSPAESEVVRLIASGMTSKAIADTLGRSHKTIENQTHGALKKLKHQGIHRRVDLVRWALIVRL
jgi:DNA-binding NarL/FixJ family response regulator